MEVMVLDTSFLVDFERELRREKPGRAHLFLNDRRELRLVTTITVAGELASGASLAERPLWEELLEPFVILPVTKATAWNYGQIYKHLKSRGMLIGANDLWIAAVAVERNLPVLTSNFDEFQRVANLRVETY